MIQRLTVRADFLRAAKAPYAARTAVVVQARARGDDDAMIRLGFTATKKVGNAVARNRAKRRLREAARALIPTLGLPGHDYVFIARAITGEQPWQALLDDVKAALLRLAAKGVARPKPAPQNPAHAGSDPIS